MKLKKYLVLFLLITVVLSLASCQAFGKLGIGKKHTIKFDSDGGTAIADQVVKSGSTAFEPVAPTKDGYVFAGWFNGESQWDFSTAVEEDMTLKAKWEFDTANCPHEDMGKDGICDVCEMQLEYKITYLDGKKSMSLKPNKYSMLGSGINLPTATKDHYEFVGWYADKELTEAVTTLDTTKGGDITLYAKFTPITYTITYNLGGGTNAEGNPTTCTADDKFPIALQDPTRDGYVFLGWFTDNMLTEPITEITKSKISGLTLYARWAKEEDKFTVTYLDHLGNELLVDTLYKSENDQPLRSYDDEIFEGKLSIDGYFFISWVDASNESQAYVAVPAGHGTNMVVKASLKNEATHNLLYYVDGSYYATGTFFEVDGIGQDGFYIPEKGGYTFDGWYSDRACTTKVTAIAPNTLEDVKLYGKFIPKTYSITFEVDGVTVDLGMNEYTTSSTAYTLPEIPAKNGYVILGWYTAEGQLMEANEIAAEAFGNLALHAVYEKVTYKITYHLSGGTNDERNVTEYRYEELPTLYGAGYKTGYVFAGWYTDASFSGTPITSLEAFANQDISLFALWLPDIDEDHSTETPAVPL